MKYCSQNVEYSFDFYIHHWVAEPEHYPVSPWASDAIQACEDALDYQLKTYNPKRHLFEKQKKFGSRDLHPQTQNTWASEYVISNMISQVYSLSTVCNLVEDSEDYEWFIALRSDCELGDNPLLNTLNSSEVYCYSDVMQVFGKNTLGVYRRLMETIREIPVRGRMLDAELLRRYPLQLEGIVIHEMALSAPIIRRGGEEVILEHGAGIKVTRSGAYFRRERDRWIIKLPPGSNRRVKCSFPVRLRFSGQDEWYEMIPVNGTLVDMNNRISDDPIVLEVELLAEKS